MRRNQRSDLLTFAHVLQLLQLLDRFCHPLANRTAQNETWVSIWEIRADRDDR